jgi:hypothetical protein
MTTTTYDYHTGLTSYQMAIDAARDALADGEISMSENPQVKTYYVTTRDGRNVQRWKITLDH